MKVFISWSGARSKAVAELLSEWVKCVLQATRPWLSTRDIDRGALWFGEINSQLKDTAVGIVCLTQENLNRPWILFEAGALAKGLSSNRVCTLLIDLEPNDISDPLAQFNHTLPDRAGMGSLVRTLNAGLEAGALDEPVLSQVFDTYWPQFETKFANVLEEHPVKEPKESRSKEEVLDEILATTRSMQSRLRRLEADWNSRPDNVHSGYDVKPWQTIVESYQEPKEALVLAEQMLVTGSPHDEIVSRLCFRYGLPLPAANSIVARAQRMLDN